MNTLEKKIFHKLKKIKRLGAARSLAKTMLRLRSDISEAQFDQYHTLLGTEALSQRLTNPTERQQRKLESFDQSNRRQPKKQLRIAVCLSGQPRSLVNCLDSLRRFFHGHEVTYFCHSWQGQTDPKLLVPLGRFYFSETTPPETSDFERRAIQQYGLKDFNNGVKVPYVSPNVFPMWNGIQQAYLSINKHQTEAGQFDLICRMRYDNFWVGQFDIEDFNFSDDCVVIDRNYNGYGGYGDQFAIGSPRAMAKYFNLYDWLISDFLRGGYPDKCFPEVILGNYLKDSGLSVVEEDFGLRLLRDDYVGMSPHDIPLRNHLVSKERNARLSSYVKELFPKEWHSD